MKKLILLFTLPLILLTSSCSNSQPEQTATTKQQPAKEDLTKRQKPMPARKADQLKTADPEVKARLQKAIDKQKKEIQQKPTLDATGKPIRVTVEQAEIQGENLGKSYCNCLKQHKDPVRCNGIPIGVENFEKRYGSEIGTAIMNSFKKASKGCK